MLFGYIRLSKTSQQSETSQSYQQETLLQYGVSPDKILIDLDVSGDQNQKTLNHLIATMSSGDTLVATQLDRISRSVSQFCKLLDLLNTQGKYLCIIFEGIDTKSNSISQQLLINILMSFAQFELQTIRERTKQILKAKKSEGVVLGRPKGIRTQKTQTQLLALSSMLEKQYSPRQIIQTLGITRSYFYQLKGYLKNNVNQTQ